MIDRSVDRVIASAGHMRERLAGIAEERVAGHFGVAIKRRARVRRPVGKRTSSSVTVPRCSPDGRPKRPSHNDGPHGGDVHPFVG